MPEIFFEEKGKGLPVVLLHGFCENHELWLSFLHHLSKTNYVLVPDLPGFGNSELPSNDFSLADVAGWLKKWLDHKNIERCVMIGHSLGGYVTLEFAKAYPEAVSAIGLFHSSAFSDHQEKKDNRTKTIEFLKSNGVAPFIQTFVPGLFYEGNHEELNHRLAQQKDVGMQCKLETVISYTIAMRDRSGSEELIRNFQKPFLLIAGVHDNAVPLEKSKKMAEMIPHADTHFLENAAHMGMFEQEAETLKIVEQFLKKVPREV